MPDVVKCPIENCEFTFTDVLDRDVHLRDVHDMTVVAVTKTGKLLTEEDLDRLADEAERGYDIDVAQAKVTPLGRAIIERDAAHAFLRETLEMLATKAGIALITDQGHLRNFQLIDALENHIQYYETGGSDLIEKNEALCAAVRALLEHIGGYAACRICGGWIHSIKGHDKNCPVPLLEAALPQREKTDDGG